MRFRDVGTPRIPMLALKRRKPKSGSEDISQEGNCQLQEVNSSNNPNKPRNKLPPPPEHPSKSSALASTLAFQTSERKTQLSQPGLEPNCNGQRMGVF